MTRQLASVDKDSQLYGVKQMFQTCSDHHILIETCKHAPGSDSPIVCLDRLVRREKVLTFRSLEMAVWP